MERRQFIQSLTVATASLSMAGKLFAQEFVPVRPLRITVPFGAGGGIDSFARALEATASNSLPVPLVISNRPGSGGMVGAAEAATAPADGYNYLLTSSGSFLLTSMFRDTDVSPLESFDAVAQIGVLRTSLMVPQSSPFQTLDELVAHARDNPGQMRWAHTGLGSFHQVAGQGFLNASGLEAVGVPFQGGSSTRAAVMGAQVDFGMVGIQQAAGFEEQLRPLALVSDERDAFASDVPTFGELGYDVPLVITPVILFAPIGTSAEARSVMEDALRNITADPAFAEIMATRGNIPEFLPGDEARAVLENMREEVRPILAAL